MDYPFLSPHKEGLVLDIWVVPGSSKETLAGLYGDFLKLKVVQPPESGKANKGVCAFFARLLAVPINEIELLSGQVNRHKRLLIKGKTVAEAVEVFKSVANLQ